MAASIRTKKEGFALHLALCGGISSEVLIRTLIEVNEMALQEKESDGKYPIHCAFDYKQPNEVIEILMDADPLAMQRRNDDGECLLHLACKNENVTIFDYMLRHSSTLVNIKNFEGSTPLHTAVAYQPMFQNSENVNYVVEKLLQHPEIDVNARNNAGTAPLHTACYLAGLVAFRQLSFQNVENSNIYIEVVEQLLQHPDIDVNARDGYGITPLHRASESVCVLLVKKLLDYPFILINEKKFDGKSPLDLAKENIEQSRGSERGDRLKLPSWVEIIRLLEEYPVKRRWHEYQYFSYNFMT